ncbi:MASE1 domain-containing protein [Myxococcota bacterium]|nr:MASE1 domain-containing protein [Myxococcota bacterium]
MGDVATPGRGRRASSVVSALAIAVAYAALGLAGRAMASAPGEASPVFPAAGLAIGLAIVLGARALAGIWLGGLVLHALLAPAVEESARAPLLVSIAYATGATLQAALARWLVVHGLGERWRRLETERDIALLLTLAGPIACVVSATVGVGALVGAGHVAPEWGPSRGRRGGSATRSASSCSRR